MGGMDDIENTLPPYGVSFRCHILTLNFQLKLERFHRAISILNVVLSTVFFCPSNDSFGLIPLRGRVTQ